MSVVLGFDPGGKHNGKGRFGWSVCDVPTDAREPLQRVGTGRASDAWDALDQTRKIIDSNGLGDKSRVLAAGIDAPLLWGKRGSRAVDGVVRDALRDSGFAGSKLGGAVQDVNSLRGACVVQGVLLAKYLRETWPEVEITETHPKALKYLLDHSNQPEVASLGPTVERLTAGLDEHQRDAALSAVAAWAMHRRLPGWRNLFDQERCPVQPFDTPVSYWMPIAEDR